MKSSNSGCFTPQSKLASLGCFVPGFKRTRILQEDNFHHALVERGVITLSCGSEEYVVAKTGDVDKTDILTEIEAYAILSEYPHPNVAYSLMVQKSENLATLVLPDLGMDLRAFVESRIDPLKRKQVRRIFSCIAKGVSHLHSVGILHADIKPDNIFIDKSGNVRIGDFGNCQMMYGDVAPNGHPEVVTLMYRPFDRILGNNAFYKAGLDIWSLGCVLAFLAGGRDLFDAWDEEEMIEIVPKILGKPGIEIGLESLPEFGKCKFPKKRNKYLENLNLSDSGVKLLRDMLRYSEAMRISIDCVLGSDYLSE